MTTCVMCGEEIVVSKGEWFYVLVYAGSDVESATEEKAYACTDCVVSRLNRDKIKRFLANFFGLLTGVLLIPVPMVFLGTENEFVNQLFGLIWLGFIIYMLVRIARLHKVDSRHTEKVIHSTLFKAFIKRRPDLSSGESHCWSKAEHDRLISERTGSDKESKPGPESSVNEFKPDNFQLVAGLLVFAVFGALTWWQLVRFSEESEWIIFQLGFIPVPTVLLSGAAALGGFWMVKNELLPRLRRVTGRSSHQGTSR